MLTLILILLALTALVVIAIHTPRIEIAVLTLAGISALTAAALYQTGAAIAGVIELSVGAGLVAVLFAFANSILDWQSAARIASPVPRRVALLLAVPVIILCAGVVLLSFDPVTRAISAISFQEMFWENRAGDVFVQLMLIFVTVAGVLSLLAERKEQAPVDEMPPPETITTEAHHPAALTCQSAIPQSERDLDTEKEPV